MKTSTTTLTWDGKSNCLGCLHMPIDKSFSKEFKLEDNVFIEGDNLDSLRLMQEDYTGKIKCIYIDPPYNTRQKRQYRDKFSHDEWLNMMYPRLTLARNLLRDDGVIFISIDDNEVHHLRMICDEIFGEGDFVAQFVWRKKTAPNNVIIGTTHDYIAVYAKQIDNVGLFLQPRNIERDLEYKNPDSDPRGVWKPDNLTSAAKGGRATQSLLYVLTNPVTGQEHYPPTGRMWAITHSEMQKKISNNSIYWGKNGDGKPMNKRFLSETRNGMVFQTIIDNVGSNGMASKELQKIFNDMMFFETPKPTLLIKKILQISTSPSSNDIILDFFAGSCTTAHAVMKLNAEDGGNRKFIMVQLPEPCDEKSEAFKAGYKTIADIGRERIRRAAKKIQEEHPDFECNFKDVCIMDSE